MHASFVPAAGECRVTQAVLVSYLPVCHNEIPVMKTRLILAMGAYAFLALLAGFTLQHPFRTAVWVLLGGMAIKTIVAARSEETK